MSSRAWGRNSDATDEFLTGTKQNWIVVRRNDVTGHVRNITTGLIMQQNFVFIVHLVPFLASAREIDMWKNVYSEIYAATDSVSLCRGAVSSTQFQFYNLILVFFFHIICFFLNRNIMIGERWVNMVPRKQFSQNFHTTR